MLAGARLGDQARLAHAFGQQPLGEHLVGLVCAAVEQVLALQIDVAGKVAASRERRRPPSIIRKQIAEFGGKGRVVLRVEERRFELLERGDEDFGDVKAAEPSEPAVQAHSLIRWRETGRRASNRAAIFSGDFSPGRSSTEEPTSIA